MRIFPDFERTELFFLLRLASENFQHRTLLQRLTTTVIIPLKIGIIPTSSYVFIVEFAIKNYLIKTIGKHTTVYTLTIINVTHAAGLLVLRQTLNDTRKLT